MPKKERARIFVGSSRESLPLAHGFAANFDHDDDFQAVVWEYANFQLSRATLPSLEALLDEYGFAVFLWTADDTVNKRGDERPAPRDNLIFESGLFLGKLGGKRTVIVQPRDVKLHVPSDLTGIETAPFTPPQDKHDPRECAMALSGAADLVRAHFRGVLAKEQQEARDALERNIQDVRAKLETLTDEKQKIRLVTTSLEWILERHAQASARSVHNTLQDVLLWAWNLLDVLDVRQLRDAQGLKPKEVFVFAPVPLECVAVDEPEHRALRETVKQNLLAGVNYWYFVADEEGDDGVGRILNLMSRLSGADKKTEEKLRAATRVVVLPEEYFMTYYTMHKWADGPADVFQSVIREDRNDFLIRLAEHQAKEIHRLIAQLVAKTVERQENGAFVRRMKSRPMLP